MYEGSRAEPVIRVSHLFFDFDGVLCDSLQICVEEYEILRKARFTALPPTSMRSRMDVPYSDQLRTSLLRWISTRESAEFFDAHAAAMRRRSDELSIFEGIGQLLEALPPASCSIVSSAYFDEIVRVLSARTGVLPKAIRNIVGRDSRLPKYEKLLNLLKKYGMSPSEAIYVGDLYSDLLYAKQVRMKCILVSYGYNTPQYLRAREDGEAVAIVDSVRELRDNLLAIMEKGS